LSIWIQKEISLLLTRQAGKTTLMNLLRKVVTDKEKITVPKPGYEADKQYLSHKNNYFEK